MPSVHRKFPFKRTAVCKSEANRGALAIVHLPPRTGLMPPQMDGPVCGNEDTSQVPLSGASPARDGMDVERRAFRGHQLHVHVVCGRHGVLHIPRRRRPSAVGLGCHHGMAAVRWTIRGGDVANCLLGTFGINLPLLHGEGKRAFRRLRLEIMQRLEDFTIFAWSRDYDGRRPQACSVP